MGRARNSLPAVVVSDRFRDAFGTRRGVEGAGGLLSQAPGATGRAELARLLAHPPEALTVLGDHLGEVRDVPLLAQLRDGVAAELAEEVTRRQLPQAQRFLAQFGDAPTRIAASAVKQTVDVAPVFLMRVLPCDIEAATRQNERVFEHWVSYLLAAHARENAASWVLDVLGKRSFRTLLGRIDGAASPMPNGKSLGERLSQDQWQHITREAWRTYALGPSDVNAQRRRLARQLRRALIDPASAQPVADTIYG